MSAGFSALSRALFALAWTIPDSRFITLMLVVAFLRVRYRSEHVTRCTSRAGGERAGVASRHLSLRRHRRRAGRGGRAGAPDRGGRTRPRGGAGPPRTESGRRNRRPGRGTSTPGRRTTTPRRPAWSW